MQLPQEREIEYLQFLEDVEENPLHWLRFHFPDHCSKPFAPHHEDHWNFIWSIEPDIAQDPLIELWARGHGKSTGAELAITAVAARNVRKCGLYICGTQKQAEKHARSISSLLVSKEFAATYPVHSRRKLSKYGHSQGWNGYQLATAAGFVIFFIGLDCEFRGAKWEFARPDFFVFDDVDSKLDTPATVEKKIEIITTSLLPAAAPHAIVLFVQNLIHRNSIASRLSDNRAEFLSTRRVIGPIPAINNLEVEKRAGRPGHDITAGEPTWKGMDIAACQVELDRMGLAAFLAECQHNVDIPEGGAIYKEWNEAAHVISWSQFEKVFHVEHIPTHWKLARGQDWGATDNHPCITTWMARASENAPQIKYEREGKRLAYKLSGKIFAYRELAAFKLTPRQIAEKIISLELPLREADRMQFSITGHDNKPARDTYAMHHNLSFDTATPDRCGGIPQMLDYLQIDHSLPHPFKSDRLLKDGTYEIGCPSIFYLVDDDQLDAPINDRGFLRHRQEFPSYHYDEPVAGEAVVRLIPYSFMNDAMDSDRMIAGKFFPSIAELSPQELFEQAMPEALKLEAIEQMNAQQKASAWHLREARRVQMEQEDKGTNSLNWIYSRRAKR